MSEFIIAKRLGWIDRLKRTEPAMSTPRSVPRRVHIAAGFPVIITAIIAAIVLSQSTLALPSTQMPANTEIEVAGVPRPGFIVWNTTVDIGSGIWYDNASSIYITGYHYDPGFENITVEKWDTQGNPIWSRTWGGNASDIPAAIHGDTEGNIYVCGETTSFGIGDKDLLLLKYAANGMLLWNRTWGSHVHATRNEVGADVICDQQGNVYTCGSMVPSNGANKNMLLIKWASNGTQLWNKTYGGTNNEAGVAMTLTPMGEIFVFGQYYLPSPTKIDTIVTKWGANGTLLLSRTDVITSGYYEKCIDAPSHTIPNLLFTVSFKVGGTTPSDIDVSRWYMNGTRQWHTTYGCPLSDTPFDIIETTGGSVLIAGASEMPFPVNSEGYLVKINPEGEIVWNITWAENSITSILKICESDVDCFFTIFRTETEVFLSKINVTAIDAQFLDADNDMITDYDEVYTYGTSPSRADTDRDGLDDWSEIFVYGTDPTLADTDSDGASDAEEISGGTDPLDQSDNPAGHTTATVVITISVSAGAAVAIALTTIVLKKKKGRQVSI